MKKISHFIDGKTYSNDCYADRHGVVSYVAGECCD